MNLDLSKYLKMPRPSHFLVTTEIWGKPDRFKDFIIPPPLFFLLLNALQRLSVKIIAKSTEKKVKSTKWEIWGNINHINNESG